MKSTALLAAGAVLAFAAFKGGSNATSSQEVQQAPAPAAPAAPQGRVLPPETVQAVLDTYGDEINEAATVTGLRPDLIARVIAKESAGNLYAVGDGGAALGLMQMHAAAASDVGADWASLLPTDPTDEQAAARRQILDGAAYLAIQFNRFGDERQALIAYNQGGGVAAAGDSDRRFAAGAAYAASVLGDA